MSDSTRARFSHPALRMLARLAGLLRDGWLILGISILLIGAVEVLYRAEHGLHGWLYALTSRAPARPVDLRAGEAWWAELHRAFDEFERSAAHYDSARGWWPDAYHSRWLNVGDDGLRQTIQTAAQGPARKRVFMLGGSTMWGFGVRDQATIASQTWSLLHAEGVADVDVSNLAQFGFVLNQGVATLIRELSRGNVPTVAVFLDGVNDVSVVASGEEPGDIYNEKELRERTWQHKDGSAAVSWLADNLQLVSRLRQMRGEQNAAERDLRHVIMGMQREDYFESRPLSEDQIAERCDDIAGRYRNLIRVVQAAAHAYGFKAVFYWQPMLPTSQKTRGPWEQYVESTPDPVAALLRPCLPHVRAAMAAVGEGSGFQDLSDLFDRETDDVFTDNFGHLTERATATLAQRIERDLSGLLKGG